MKVNPRGKIPVLIDKGHTILESNTILRYLADSRKVDESYLPRTDLIERTKVDSALDWSSTSIRPALLPYINQTWFRPLVGLGHPTQEQKDKLRMTASNALKEVDEFVKVGSLTIADLQIFEEVHLATECTDLKVKDYPNLNKWYSKIFENEHVQFYHHLMVKDINKDFPDNGIKFTEI